MKPTELLERAGTLPARSEAAPATRRRDRARPRRSPTARAEGRVGFGVFLTLLCAYAYFITPASLVNPDSHLFLTVSLVDRHITNIDPYQNPIGDQSFSHGHYYSDKAPGLALMGVLVYAPVEAAIRESYDQLRAIPTPEGNDLSFILRYFVTLCLVSVPAALLGWLLFRFTRVFGLGLGDRALLALAYGLGTIAFPFATLLFSHQVAAALLFAAFVALYGAVGEGRSTKYEVRSTKDGEGRTASGQREAASTAGLSGSFVLRTSYFVLLRTLIAGGMAGLALACEYPAAIGVVALGVYALYRGRWRAGVWYAAGVAPFVGLVGLYNAVSFGSPFSLGYSHLAGPAQFVVGQSRGLFGVTLPSLWVLGQILFSAYRGLLFLSPFLALGFVGLVVLLRRPGFRAEAWCWSAIVVGWLVFNSAYFEWNGGGSLGPRHLLPMLPFLAAAIAPLLPRLRTLLAVLLAPSVILVGIGTLAFPLASDTDPNPVFHYALDRLELGRVYGNWGMTFGWYGLWSFIPLAVLLAALVGYVAWQAQTAVRSPDRAASNDRRLPHAAPP